MTIIGHKELTSEEILQIVFEVSDLKVHEDCIEKITANHLFLKSFAQNKIIYGINTGFGPMAQYKIEDDHLQMLQYNLIRSHCAGAGNELDTLNVRSIMLARLNTLIKAKSGIHHDMVLLLCAMLNLGIYPVIKEHGSVGASGDLVQLAHLALAMIGEGEVIYDQAKHKSAEILKHHGLSPLQMYIREGIALMNGTSAMTGIGIVNLIHARRLMQWTIIVSSLLHEIVNSHDDYFSSQLNQSKHHIGQRKIAEMIRALLKGSQQIKSRSENLYANGVQETQFRDKVQEYYSIRCVPQILGPIYDTIAYTENVLLNEINSVNDNPIVDDTTNNVYHGGNFHGDYVALEMDKLKIAITKLSILAERQLNFLLNDKLNEKLPPFINKGILGLNFGLQGAQFTATSTVAENQTLSSSMYIHNIPSNKDNQDVVSMGTNAALMTQKVINNSFQVLAIEIMAVREAISYLGIENKLAPATQYYYKIFSNLCPLIDHDRIPPYQMIAEVEQYCKNNLPDIPTSQNTHDTD